MAKNKIKPPILADMHTHLNEKNISPKDWWEAAREKKLAAIAITEHAEYDPGFAYSKLIELKPKNIILIPGMEAKTSAGHLLVFGTNKSLYSLPKLQQINVPIEEALEIVQRNGLLASFSHPYGYKADSTCLILGEAKTKQLLKKYRAGTEYYNGMLGSANNFIFATQWIKKLYNFFDFAEKSRAGKAFMIAGRSGKIKRKLEEISQETLERVRKGMIFSKNAAFITAGSDAHYPRSIGTAVVKLKKRPHSEKEFLEMIRGEEIIWAGPNIYAREPVDKLRKKELLEGLRYITAKKVKKKMKKPKIARKIRKKMRIKRIKKKFKALR